MLVGRAAESAWLNRRLALARRGEGGAILVTGEPGVGKTALVREVSGAADGVMALRGGGVESEASLGFSVLADVCRPLLDLLERVPEAQAAALSGALALGPAVALDRFAAYAGALSLLAVAAECQPVLVCVDDAHWVDVESAQALAFCARRIYAERIMLVLVARAAEALPFAIDAFESLALDGLGLGASAELLAATRGSGVDRRVAERLQAATAGNPLALIETGSLLSDAQLTGRSALEEPLQVGAAIERLFWRQIAGQPESVQKALLLAATSNTGSIQEIEPALEAVGLTIGDLERAETVGLVTIANARIEFKHPLVRAVVYRAAQAHERRTAHGALSDTVTGPGASLQRAWHRAGATAGVDESVAQSLEQAATGMAMRTGFAAAASALERAATLSETDEKRAQRLLAAGTTAFLAGMLGRARAASGSAVQYAEDPGLQADCQRLRAIIESYAGNVFDAHRMLVDAAERVAPGDPAREAQFLSEAAVALVTAGEVGSAREVAQLAYKRATEIGGETELLARKWLGLTMLLCGEGSAGYQLVIEGLEREAQHAASFERQLIAQWGVLCAVWVEDYERARAVSAALLSRWRGAGALTHLPFGLAVLSELEFRTGRWAAALAAAGEAVSIASETGLAAYGLVYLAGIEAAIGREQATHEHVGQALSLAEQGGAGSITVYARAALARLELGLSRPERARDQLAPLAELARQQGLGEPGVVWWQPDWIEANIRLGDLEQAHHALAQLEREASNLNRIWALAAAARYRGLTAPDQQFEQHFAHALALHERTPTPFERARTQLCLGERLRRAGERRRAREQFDHAVQTFRRLGAEPWAWHAERELSASGATRTKAPDAHTARPPQELLTAQELQIAIAVSEGQTNKQAAATLFLSPKTIEFHLGHIYRKLDIRSRTQLALKMLADPQTATSPPAPRSSAEENSPAASRS